MREYVLKGEPISRVKMIERKVWSEQSTIKMAHEFALKEQHGTAPLYTGPLHLEVIFLMPIPENWNEQRRSSYDNKEHSGRPAISNLLRFLQDIACGTLYKDDCIVESMIIHKRYGLDPRTIIRIRENHAV